LLACRPFPLQPKRAHSPKIFWPNCPRRYSTLKQRWVNGGAQINSLNSKDFPSNNRTLQRLFFHPGMLLLCLNHTNTFAGFPVNNEAARPLHNVHDNE